MRLVLMLLMFLMPSAAFSQTGTEEATTGNYFHMPINMSLYVTQYRDYSLGRALGGGRPVVNYLALNVFSGKAARLYGAEVGGLGNVIQGDMLGVMGAGVGNVTSGNGLGVQAAGIVNMVDGSFAFLQAGGIANVVQGRFWGGQASLVANMVGNNAAGIQITGVANVVNGRFTGLQGSVVANVSGESYFAMQMGGVANVSNGNLRGIQVAGVANVVNANVAGIQFAGIANVANGNSQGLQGAGIANVANGNVRGVRLAGIANINNANVHGILVGGVANIANARLSGIELSGVASVNNGDVRGIQGAGIAGVTNGNLIGAQLAGVANVANGTINGVQTSGILNVAMHAGKLVQAGAINVSQGGNVLPLGIYSVVGDAPSYYDYWVSETGFVNAGIRSGSEWFHNLVFAGLGIGDPMRWSLGWGAGVHHALDSNLFVDFEGSVQHINEDEFWTSKKNLLTKVRVAGVWQFSDTAALYAGPTFNYLVSRVNDGSDIAPWSMTDDQSGSTWKRSWIGIDLGLRITRPPEDMGMFDFLDFLDI